MQEKEYIVQQAENLSYSTDYRNAKEEMKNLRQRLKSLPRLSKEEDDRLWSRFNQASDRLFDSAQKDYENRKRMQSDAKFNKEALIREAESLSYSNDYRNAKDQMKKLMDQWKSMPRASREDENDLWNRFKAASDRIYNNDRIAREQRQREFSEAKSKKENIISQIEGLVYSCETREAADAVKRLSDEFYNVGSAGNYNEELKRRLKDAKDRFYSARKQASDVRHKEHLQRLQETIFRKKEQLRNLESAIYRKEDQLRELLSRPEPGYNNPHRYEIAARRNERESQLNSALSDMKIRRQELINTIYELESKANRG
ncbi:MAG: DUF349 domain-containing protein [Eubacterium sp.]|nr:DUF349 domain-containing protein [Eubacterium sp.]